jgi:TolA-binding protein
MIYPLGGLRLKKAALLAGLAMAWAGTVVPAGAQGTMMEERLRRMEAEIRSLQGNKTGSDGKVFTPEVSASTAPAAALGQPAVSPMTDVLTRMDAIEAQIKQLTAQSEINSNRLAKLEAAAAAPGAVPSPAVAAAPAGPAPAMAGPAPAATTTPASVANMDAMTGGASSPKPAGASARPSPQRVAAVSAIVKPQTNDPGDDEYSYGSRLWEAKFYPEAQQQLKLTIDKYPRHPKISYARNLLGRAYLDDGKPREAASWFLQNYKADKTGDRAPDSLLYLAESMRQLHDTSRACIALSEFADTYPREAANRLKSQYDATRGGLKCN